MQAPSISQYPNAWYEAYKTLTLSPEQAAFLLDTLRQPLSKEDFDKSDLGGVLIEFVGNWFEQEKCFEDALDFLHQFEQLQPLLYAGELHFYASYIMDYYCFVGQAERAEPVIRFFREHPNQDIDFFLPIQEAVWYWLRQDWGIPLAAETYRPVQEHGGYFGYPEKEMAMTMHVSSLQTAYQQWLSSGTLHFEESKKVASDHHFVIADAVWERYAVALSTPIDTATATSRFETEVRVDFMAELNLRFLVWMHEKGFPFYGAQLIWYSLCVYWEESHPKTKHANGYFGLKKQSFEAYIVGKKNLMFPKVKEMGATLWGAPFVYDFLGDIKIIEATTRNEALLATEALKQSFFKGFASRAWEVAFVVKAWPKADAIPQDDFDGDIARFEDSFHQVSQPSTKMNRPFDNLIASLMSSPSAPASKPAKPTSFYEQVFGNKPPTTSKNKKKKKKKKR